MSKASQVHNENSAMQKLIEDKGLTLKNFKVGDLIEGVVVSISHGEILLDIGSKSEGIISGSELFDTDNTAKNLKLGDKLFAKVIQLENNQGYIVLSIKKAESERKWKDAEDALDNGSILEASVVEYNKGGLLVDCLGIRGFIPLSHLDRVHFSNDLSKFASGSEAELKEALKPLSGKNIKVKVIVDDNTSA